MILGILDHAAYMDIMRGCDIMTIKELEELKEGTILQLNLGDGWFRGCKFIGLVDKFYFKNGVPLDVKYDKVRKMAKIMYKSDFGGWVTDYVAPRRLSE